MFIAGLKELIQEKVELQQPTSLAEAMALALHLAASQEERNVQFNRNRWRENRSSSAIASAPSPTITTPLASGRDGERSMLKPIRVSSMEKSERSKRGLCFYCPEKWVRDHICQTKMLSYFGEKHADIMTQDEERATEEDIITDDLSRLKALEGSAQSRPFRILGSISHAPVNILIDTGSTHDFCTLG